MFTYYKGSDGYWYCEAKENANHSSYTYSNGETVSQGGTNSKWFKVEPIKWRVVIHDSDSGKKLLLAEEGLMASVPYYDDTNDRTIGGKTIHPINYKHSKIRAWLNGTTYHNKSGVDTDEHEGKGFFHTAFTAEQRTAIGRTTVDNSPASTNPASNPTQWNNGKNPHACEDTYDKIFLLSEKEATTGGYGFAEVSNANDSSRIRKPTDFALANNAYIITSTRGGNYSLRSPFYDNSKDNVRGVSHTGNAFSTSGVVDTSSAVVPALCIAGTGVDLDKLGAYTELPDGTDGTDGTSGAYITFGTWPQTIKGEGVAIDETNAEKKEAGMFTYYKGDDGEWYCKAKENASGAEPHYQYSNGEQANQSSADSYKWFKVEPIKWRVLTNAYSGKRLFFGENGLMAMPYYDDKNDRTIDNGTVYANNYKHSKIRAWLNGIAYNQSGTDTDEHKGKGFLQTAFTAEEQAKIAQTTVDNSDASTGWPDNPNVCEDTNDKIFLLSTSEAQESYFTANSRIRKVTDFALANGVYIDSSFGDKGRFWLRSPHYGDKTLAQYVFTDGDINSQDLDSTSFLVMPALCIEGTGVDLDQLGAYTELQAGEDGTAGIGKTYVTFGTWPQTIKDGAVTIKEATTEIKEAGMFTYYKGSDGQWYCKAFENAAGNSYTYSNGETANPSSANSYKWFKVQPIKWRVLTNDYSGKKLLLAEEVLMADVQYYDGPSTSADIRTIDGKDVRPNNYKHSKIRAWLNGIAYQKDNTQNTEHEDNGFLQTAFTAGQEAKIAETTVDNSEASTNPASNPLQLNGGKNDYACEDTYDKIFLLSMKEATTYGFEEAYNKTDNSRSRKPTDFALANRAELFNNSGSWWWLRSPHWNSAMQATSVNNGGSVNLNSRNVNSPRNTVVPALSFTP